ncbi:MAG: phosphoribosylformylglycinamidine synthase subunit PurQ [Saprospiraceae bacterium]
MLPHWQVGPSRHLGEPRRRQIPPPLTGRPVQHCRQIRLCRVPANPNGSDYTAMICSADGRHLATMPHFERSMFKWNWANYPTNRQDDISPWVEAFLNARRWLEKNT